MLTSKKIKIKQEQGAISIAFALSAIVMTFLLAVTSMSYIGSDTKGASNQLIKNKAFYGAEAGIELALGELKNGGDGEFTNVAIGDALVSSTVTGDTLISVSSTVENITRSLEVVANVQTGSVLPDAFNYTVSTFRTNKKLKFEGDHYAYLDSDVFTYNDEEVEFEDNFILDNLTVHVEQGTYIDNQTSYSITLDEFAPSSNPVAWPTLNTQYYDDYINNVGGYNEQDDEIEEETIYLSNYTDNVYYCDDDLEIDEATIVGPGVVVSTDDIDIEGNSDINPDVHIIAGDDIYINEMSDVRGMGSILYASDKVELTGSLTGVHGAIISPNYVKIENSSTYSYRDGVQGIVYAGNYAKIKHTIIHGSIVTDYVYDEEIKCTEMKWLSSYLPTTVPPGFTGGSSSITVTVKNGTWREN